MELVAPCHINPNADCIFVAPVGMCGEQAASMCKEVGGRPPSPPSKRGRGVIGFMVARMYGRMIRVGGVAISTARWLV